MRSLKNWKRVDAEQRYECTTTNNSILSSFERLLKMISVSKQSSWSGLLRLVAAVTVVSIDEGSSSVAEMEVTEHTCERDEVDAINAELNPILAWLCPDFLEELF